MTANFILNQVIFWGTRRWEHYSVDLEASIVYLSLFFTWYLHGPNTARLCFLALNLYRVTTTLRTWLVTSRYRLRGWNFKLELCIPHITKEKKVKSASGDYLRNVLGHTPGVSDTVSSAHPNRLSPKVSRTSSAFAVSRFCIPEFSITVRWPPHQALPHSHLLCITPPYLCQAKWAHSHPNNSCFMSTSISFLCIFYIMNCYVIFHLKTSVHTETWELMGQDRCHQRCVLLSLRSPAILSQHLPLFFRCCLGRSLRTHLSPSSFLPALVLCSQ